MQRRKNARNPSKELSVAKSKERIFIEKPLELLIHEEKQRRIKIYAERFELNLDIWTGEPLDVSNSARNSEVRN